MVDWWLPANVAADPESRRRGRLIVQLSMICSVGIGATALSRATFNDPGAIAPVLAVLLAVLPIPLLRISHSVRLTGAVLIVLGLLGLSAIAWLNGGILAPPLIALAMVTLAAGFVLGPRVAVVCGLGAATIIATFLAMFRLGLSPPSTFTSATELWTQHAFVEITTIAIVLFFVAAYESERREKEGQLEDASRVLAAQAAQALAGERAKGAFLATMSHEIRTPLNAIINMNELLLDGTHDPRLRGYLDTTGAASRTLLELINGVLDHSRLESGGLELSVAAFSLRDLVAELRALFANQAQHRRLQLSLMIDAAVVDERIGDRIRIKQILTNLLTNALKFTKAGEVVLVMTAGDVSDELCVAVRDTGIGVAAEKRELIFQSFQQADEATSLHYGGTGLGLSISNELLALMGSQLVIESELGVGSTFQFQVCLPIADSAPLRAVQTTLPAGALSGVRILVVDDVLANRAVLEAILAPLGATVDLADDGDVAVERAIAAPYDVALMDLNMPRLGGLDACRQILALHPEVPVVAISASTGAAEREAARAAGMVDFLVKPVERQALFTVLQRWIDLPEQVAVESVRTPRPSNRLGVTPAQLALFVEQFAGDFESRCTELRAAYAAGDDQTMRRVAHTLRGTASTLGLNDIADAAIALESDLFEERDPGATVAALLAIPGPNTVENSPEPVPEGDTSPERCRRALLEVHEALCAGDVGRAVAGIEVARGAGLESLYEGGAELAHHVNRFEIDAAKTLAAKLLGLKLG